MKTPCTIRLYPGAHKPASRQNPRVPKVNRAGHPINSVSSFGKLRAVQSVLAIWGAALSAFGEHRFNSRSALATGPAGEIQSRLIGQCLLAVQVKRPADSSEPAASAFGAAGSGVAAPSASIAGAIGVARITARTRLPGIASIAARSAVSEIVPKREIFFAINVSVPPLPPLVP